MKKANSMNWTPNDEAMTRMVADEFMDRYGYHIDSVNATDRQKARAVRAVSERIHSHDRDGYPKD